MGLSDHLKIPLFFFLGMTAWLLQGCNEHGERLVYKPTTSQWTKLQRKLDKPPKAYDKPKEAQEFFLLKRSPGGKGPLEMERYLAAREHASRMPRFSTRTDTLLPPTGQESELHIQQQLFGTWEALGPGNIGGRTRAFLINPSNTSLMYSGGVAGGVWKTTNGGTSWTPLTDDLANLAVNSMAMDPGNSAVLYAGTGEGFFNGDMVRGMGIFKSSDGGSNWSHLTNTGTSDFYYVNDILVSPNSSQRVYAATRTGIWRSLDGGTNWTRVLNESGTTGGCLDLAVRTDQAMDYLFASCGTFTQATIWRNTDAGGAGAWNPVYTETNMGRTSLAIAPSNQSTIYALSASIDSGSSYNNGLHAVFRSTDSGATWTARVRNTDPVRLNTALLSNTVYAFFDICGFGSQAFLNQGWYDNILAVDPSDPDRVWAGGIDLFRSDDGGQNWGQASHWWANKANGAYAHADQHVIAFHPQYDGTTNQTMFVAGDGGIYRTDNARANVDSSATAPCNPTSAPGEVTWTELNNTYGVTQFYYGVPYPNGSTYFGGTQDNGTLRGDDTSGSEAWEEILGGDGGAVAVDGTDTDVLYAENTRLSIRKSTDGGGSFSDAVSGITESSNNFLFIAPFAMDPGDSSRLWTGGWYLWRTINSAGGWSRASDITTGSGSVSAVASSPLDGNYVAAGMSDGHIHYNTMGLSTGSSSSWPSSQPRSGYVSSLTWDPSTLATLYATYSTFGGGAHVWRSTNGGSTWSSIDGSGPGALPDIPVHSIVVDPSDGDRLYIGTDIGVFSSLDGGSNWQVENTGFANVVTESLAIDSLSGNVFAFTHGRGAWRVPLPGTCSVGDDVINLNSVTVTGSETHRACLRIEAGETGPVAVKNGGDLQLQSGGPIIFHGGDGVTAGFRVETGGTLGAIAGSTP